MSTRFRQVAKAWVMRRVALRNRTRKDGLTLGAYSYFLGTVCRYMGDDATRVNVGKYSSIAEGVTILAGGEHHHNWVTTSPIRILMNLPGAFNDGLPWSRGDITIGNDVWIGNGAVILSGVTVGDGAVIGARAVVRADVRPYAIVVGNPGHEVRRRFSDAQVDALLRISWWDWAPDVVADRVALLQSGDVDGFIAAYDPVREARAAEPAALVS